MFISVITSFVVFGGQTVLRNFMAKVTDAASRGRLLFTYTLIILALLFLVTGIFTIFPGLLEFFLRRKITSGVYIFFLLFSLVVIASELFSSAVAGMMNIKISTIAQSATRLLPLPVVTFFFFFNTNMVKLFIIRHFAYLFSYIFSFIFNYCID